MALCCSTGTTMDLVCRTLILSLAFALTLAGPLQEAAAGAGKLPKCSEVKLGAVTADDAGTMFFFPDIKEKHCAHHLQRHQVMMEKFQGLIGAFMPTCDENGQYQKQQCHGSTGYCWCVDGLGKKVLGTETPPGAPTVDCESPVSQTDAPQKPRTKCEEHRDKTKPGAGNQPIAGQFTPNCGAKGEFLSKQCHGSTGHCWCVDSTGEEIPGTKTGPGKPAADCEKTVQRHCDNHKARVEAKGKLLGAFSPKCDENGFYLPQQCHGSTGHCWCVDKKGKEIPGTRTGPGGAAVDCSTAGQERHCENQKSLMQGPKMIGAFEPTCDENGQFVPQQCHGSTGHCWCVDKMGNERPGTKTPAGSPSMDCQKASRFYMRLDTYNDGLQNFPSTMAWERVGDRVDAAFSCDDKMYLIKGDEIYIYKVNGNNFTLTHDRPKYVSNELGINGHVDAAFVCPDEDIVNVIQGTKMKRVDHATKVVIEELPLPLSDIDAAMCGTDGIKLFKGSDYFEYESPMVLSASRMAPTPLKITSAMMECED